MAAAATGVLRLCQRLLPYKPEAAEPLLRGLQLVPGLTAEVGAAACCCVLRCCCQADGSLQRWKTHTLFLFKPRYWRSLKAHCECTKQVVYTQPLSHTIFTC